MPRIHDKKRGCGTSVRGSSLSTFALADENECSGAGAWPPSSKGDCVKNDENLFHGGVDATLQSFLCSEWYSEEFILQSMRAIKASCRVALGTLVLSACVLLSDMAVDAVCPGGHSQVAQAVTNEQLLYLEAWRAVDRAYVDKTFNGQSWFRVREDTLKKKKLVTREDTHNEIKSMLASLDDPFTRFLDPDQYKSLKGSTKGDVTGIGLEISFSAAGASKAKELPLVVIAPSPGGPAERAGIKSADEIVEIDGFPTSKMSLYAAGNALQGPAGSTVKLTVRRPGRQNSERVLTLTREYVNVQGVDAESCKTKDDSNIGYIRIARFSNKTPEDVRSAIEELKKKNVDRFVLDLRNNGGGVFSAGVQVGRMWINQGDIVLIADRYASPLFTAAEVC